VLRLEFLALTAKTLAVAAFVLPFGIAANARNGLGKLDCPPSHVKLDIIPRNAGDFLD